MGDRAGARNGPQRCLDAQAVIERGVGRGICVVGRRWIGLEVDHVLQQLHHAEPVGDRMVDLHDERRPLGGQALDDAQLPQRAVLVERPRRHPLRVVEHLATTGAPTGEPRPGVVVVDVDVRVVGPPRRGDTGLLVENPLVQAGDPRDDPLDDGVHAGAVGDRVEEPDAGDRRAQQRIALDVPQHRVALAHPFVVVQLTRAARRPHRSERTPAPWAAHRSGHVRAASSVRDCLS